MSLQKYHLILYICNAFGFFLFDFLTDELKGNAVRTGNSARCCILVLNWFQDLKLQATVERREGQERESEDLPIAQCEKTFVDKGSGK